MKLSIFLASLVCVLYNASSVPALEQHQQRQARAAFQKRVKGLQAAGQKAQTARPYSIPRPWLIRQTKPRSCMIKGYEDELVEIANGCRFCECMWSPIISTCDNKVVVKRKCPKGQICSRGIGCFAGDDDGDKAWCKDDPYG